MRTTHRTLAVAALATAALAPAAVAQAATKHATLGYAGKPPAGTPETAAFYAYFPSKITIHKGDKVSYKVAGFGAVYSGPKSKIPQLANLDASRPVSGLNDPAGNPFWFNGQPTPSINPALLAPSGDGKVHKGQKDVDSGGLPMDEKAKPTVLTFTKPGAYKIYDALHPKVFQTVVVKPKRAKIPGHAADARRSLKEAKKYAKQAKKLAGVKPAANTILVGHDAKNVGFFQYFPGDVTVPANTPVTIDAGTTSNDTHDLVIGPDAYMADTANNLFQGGPGGVDLIASAIYPSQPGGSLTFDGSQNGGFLSTGAFAGKGGPLPNKTTITFTKPGTYKYVCLFHSNGVYAPGAENMQGTITVK